MASGRWVFSSHRLAKSILDSAPTRQQRVGSLLLGLLFPADCQVCGDPLTEFSRIPVCPGCLAEPEVFAPEFFCARCRTPFSNARPLDDDGVCTLCRLGANRFDAAYCFGAYEGTLRQLIHLFKYRGIRPLAKPLGRLLSAAMPRDVRFDAIIPVPLHWWKRHLRGFNQSLLLSRELGARTGIPVRPLLRRRKFTRPQAGLPHPQRRANVAGAFVVPQPDLVRGARLLLLDDVLTTGTTLNACAAVLKRAGAAHVSVLTLARADRRVFSFGGSLG